MRVKRYVVNSMPDALQQIRNDLGKDAVILNTKEIRSGGFLGIFGRKKIEVIAATDTSPGGSPTPHFQLPVQETALSGANHPSGAAGARPFQAATVMQQDGQAAVPPVAAPKPRITAVRTDDDVLLYEIRKMKEMVQKLSRHSGGFPAPLERLEQRLLAQEVTPALARRIVEEVAAEKPDGEWTYEDAAAALRRKLLLILKQEEGRTISPETKVAQFVGPTGVGKTTTIAKLAAEQMLKFKRKVGMITSDTYRIAAVDQLRTYATILGVPLEVVFSPHDLLKAYQRLSDCDIIFMDTAGRNFRNELYVSELNAFLAFAGVSQTFLVLSLTMKYKDMKAVTENFLKFSLNKVLFTKSDETDSYGTIINLLDEFPLELSYIANGQNVPDDIEVASNAQIVDWILGDGGDV